MVKFVTVKINDDENWEPDEDFLVELYDEDTGDRLQGADTITRVTIIDDDKPGQIAFAESKTIRAIATTESVEVKIIRKNGSDGTVNVDYETVQIDQSSHTATPGIDYVPQKGTLQFGSGEIEKSFTIQILPKQDSDRDESFGI